MLREAEVFTLSGEGVHFDRNMQLVCVWIKLSKPCRILLAFASDGLDLKAFKSQQ